MGLRWRGQSHSRNLNNPRDSPPSTLKKSNNRRGWLQPCAQYSPRPRTSRHQYETELVLRQGTSAHPIRFQNLRLLLFVVSKFVIVFKIVCHTVSGKETFKKMGVSGRSGMFVNHSWGRDRVAQTASTGRWGAGQPAICGAGRRSSHPGEPLGHLRRRGGGWRSRLWCGLCWNKKAKQCTGRDSKHINPHTDVWMHTLSYISH